MDHRVRRSADRRQSADRGSERFTGKDPETEIFSFTSSNDAPAGHASRERTGARPPRESPRCPGMPTASASIIDAIVEAVPIVMRGRASGVCTTRPRGTPRA